MANNKKAQAKVESVATILDRESKTAIQEWIVRVIADEGLSAIKFDDKRRSSHLPLLFKDLVHRLRPPLPLGNKSDQSNSAREHGLRRLHHGYSPTMLVEDSRILQVSIFHTLHKNEHRLDFGVLRSEVMVIADEVDSQLAQAMVSYIGEPKNCCEVKGSPCGWALNRFALPQSVKRLGCSVLP
jgi:hypothetical protein